MTLSSVIRIVLNCLDFGPYYFCNPKVYDITQDLGNGNLDLNLVRI